MTARRSIASRPGALLAAAAALLMSTVALAQQTGGDAARRTTKDGVYAKAQADAGKALFEKHCESCHGFKPSAKSALNPDLGGEAFLARWNGKSVRELTTLVLTTMPSDGSAVLTEDQTADVVAYVLQANGFPPGPTPLKHDASAGAITIVK